MTVRRGWTVLAAAWCALSGLAAAEAQNVKLVADSEPLTPQEQLKKFHLPPGFQIELVAAEPDCRKPMNLKFDAAGRLYFTQSIEYPWPVKEGETGRDTIRVMADSNGDGVPDRTTVYAEGLNIPIGVTPVDGGVLGYSIPTLYFFPDADGDLVADGRKEFYGTFGFRDTHGMCSSLNYWVDGWVYGCHGFANESKVVGQDGRPIVMQSGNTYRLRPDGSHIEYVSHGQVNPFGMCFDPLGNQYTSDCHTKPAYIILRGAYYPSFGKPHDGLGYGPELLQHLHGSTGIAGIVYYAAEHFPPEYRDNLFIGNPVTGRINRDTLAATGSTYKAIEQPDFLWCDDEWFRPVDVQLAPDGSLYIADFYNRIIGHYEVPLTHPGRDRERGRIWRVSYVGADGKQRASRIPDLSRASAGELAAALGHPHLPVRVLATHQLVHRIGRNAIPAATTALAAPSAAQRAHALWVLERLGALSDDQIQQLADDPDRLVRVHLVKALAERSEWTSPAVRAVLAAKRNDADAFVRRATIEAWGRHPAPGTERLLIAAWQNTDPQDELLVHTTKIALRDAVAARNSLPELEQLADLSAAERDKLVEICLGLPRADAAAFALDSYRVRPWPAALVEALTHHTGRHLDAARLPEYYRLSEQFRKQPDDVQLRVLRAYQRAAQERGAPRDAVITGWAEETAARLAAADAESSVRAGLELIRDLRLPQSADALPARLEPNAKHPGLRPLALDALVAAGHPRTVELALAVLSRTGEPADFQQHAAQVLGSLNREDSRAALTAQLKTAPQGLALAIARGLALGKPGGEALLTAIEKGQASPRLLQDPTVEQRLRAANIAELDTRRAKLLEGLPPEDDRLKQLQAARREGFSQSQAVADRGAALFQKHCGACHKLNNQGGKVGPELDGVGLRGLERLLEDTLDPNRNVDAAFRATVVALADGKVLSGLALREEGEVLILADDQGKEQRIPLKEIEERKQVKLSPMPANVAEKLTEAEYFDLLAYLLSQRTGKPAAQP